MKRRVLQRRYGRASRAASPFHDWRTRVEMILVRAFEADGMAYWTARDVAQGIVEKSRGLGKLHRSGMKPADAAAWISSSLRSRR